MEHDNSDSAGPRRIRRVRAELEAWPGSFRSRDVAMAEAFAAFGLLV